MTDEGYIIETMFRIADKEGNDVDFLLNQAQARIDRDMDKRNIVPKARQEGVSSYVLARFTAACMMKRNTRAVVISHDQESTQRMLTKVQYFIQHIRGPQPELKNMSANLISFPKMNSMFYIGTAGSRKFGRGDTITHLHCSEYAFWPNPKELMKGLLQAVPMTSGEIWIESTGNGLNDYYHRCIRAAEGRSQYKIHFLPWNDFPEYRLDMTDEQKEAFLEHLDPDLEEPDLVGKLDVEQLAWRRLKLEELDYDMQGFKQEYPMTLEECFQMTGASVFHKVHFDFTSRWERVDSHEWRLKGHPRPDLTYALGSDVSGGVGQDRSTIEVVCIDTMEQVAEYINDKIAPDAFASKVASMGFDFNTAYAVVENNNHGLLTIAELKDVYPVLKLHKNSHAKQHDVDQRLLGLGFRTTSRSKPLLIGRLRRELAGGLRVHSDLLKTELSTFIEHPDGKLAAQEGCHDDLVIALACAVVGITPAAVAGVERKQKKRVDDPFQLEGILDQMDKGRYQGPISPQNAWKEWD